MKHLNDLDSFDWAMINDDDSGFAKTSMCIKRAPELLGMLGPEIPLPATECFWLRECKQIDDDLWTGIVDNDLIFIDEVAADEHVTFTPSAKNGVELFLERFSKEQLLEMCEAILKNQNPQLLTEE